MNSSLALSLFDQIENLNPRERAEFLEGMVTQKKVESDFLEFKGCLESGNLLPNLKIRELYGKALSAFANAGGGVLIWGINAAHSSVTGYDCANSLALAPNIHQLNSALDTAEKDVTNPPVLGVRKLAIAVKGQQGFVVCLIPESRHKPHVQRLDGKDNHYYMRVGGSSPQADHSTLRRLFFPQYHSNLKLVFRVTANENSTGIPTLQIDIFLHNQGVASADDATVHFKITPKATWVSPALGWKRLSVTGGGDCLRSGEAFHSDERRHLRSLEMEAPNIADNPRQMPNPPPKFVMRISARNEPSTEVTFIAQVEDINAAEIVPIHQEIWI
jgi:hypothetical protein